MTFRKAFYFTVLFLCITSCNRAPQPVAADLDFVRHPDYNVVVGFDLRNDTTPRAILRIGHAKDSVGGTLGRIVLPFESKSAAVGPGLTTWASYSGLSHFGFVVPTNLEAQTVEFRPRFSALPPDTWDVTNARGGLFFIRRGQKRILVLRGFDRQGSPSVPDALPKEKLTRIDAVAVVRPKNAEGVEIKEGQTEMPKAAASNDVARFFVASSPKILVPSVELSYMIPLSPTDELILETILLLMAALTPTLVAFLAIKKKDIKRPLLRKLAIVFLAVAEVSILAWLSLAAYQNRDLYTTRALIQGFVVIVGFVASALVIVVQRKTVADPLRPPKTSVVEQANPTDGASPRS